MAHRIPEPVVERPALRVLPRGLARVQDYRALLEAGVNRFHGWRFDASLGPVQDVPGKGKVRPGGRVKQVDAVVEIAGDDPHWGDYVKHLKDGDLWAADPETAAIAGVAFEPHFLGEHPETATKHGVDVASDPNCRGAASVAAGLPWDTKFKPKGLPGQDAPPLKAPAPPPAAPKAASAAATSPAPASK